MNPIAISDALHDPTILDQLIASAPPKPAIERDLYELGEIIEEYPIVSDRTRKDSKKTETVNDY